MSSILGEWQQRLRRGYDGALWRDREGVVLPQCRRLHGGGGSRRVTVPFQSPLSPSLPATRHCAVVTSPKKLPCRDVRRLAKTRWAPQRFWGLGTFAAAA